jgi:hypothetical protein
MPADPWNAIADLPAMTFRGLTAPPYDMANFSGSFSLAEKRYPYIDGALYSNVGRDPIPMQFKFYFLNTLGEGLFPDLFEKWVDGVILNGSAAELQHPLLGVINAMPKSWSVQLSAKVTSGIVLDVTFVESIQDTEKSTSSTVDIEFPVIRAAAKAADADYSKLDLKWPDGARTTSLSDLIGQVEGLIFSTTLTAAGMINQATGFVGGLIDAVVPSNSNWALRSNLITTWNGLREMGKKVGDAAERTVAIQSYAIPVSLDSVAADVGNTVGEIITLNTFLVGSPMVPPGIDIRYFKT